MPKRVRGRIDEVYSKRMERVPDFKFDPVVAEAFDDMVVRSVPFYAEVQRMIGDLAARFVQQRTNVYDLGCATGTTLCVLSKVIPGKTVRFYGLDNSSAMIRQAKRKVAELDDGRITFMLRDISAPLRLINPSVIIMAFTLQFLKPLARRALVESIHDSLRPNGCLVLAEKVLGTDSLMNRLMADFHATFKMRNQYSRLEIAQKRQALENVLIPCRLADNVHLLRECGFPIVEVFFKWFNFAGLIAVKARA